jgi:hypothetical protein
MTISKVEYRKNRQNDKNFNLGDAMMNSSSKIDLEEGDLVLMSYHGTGDEGQMFKFIDKFVLDPVDERETGALKSQGDQEIPGADSAGFQETEISDSVIQALENQRTILDRAITELQGTFPRVRGSGTTSRKERVQRLDPEGAKNKSSPTHSRKVPSWGNRNLSQR